MGRVVRAGALAVAVAVFGLHPAPSLAGPQGEPKKMVFKPVDLSKTELTEKQSRLLEKVRKAKETVGEPKVVRTDVKLTAELDDPLFVPLPGKAKDLEIRNYRLRTDSSTGAKILSWKGDKPNQLTLTDGDYDGLIYAGDRVYHVEPLGAGLHAISQVDQSKLPDHPPEKKDG